LTDGPDGTALQKAALFAYILACAMYILSASVPGQAGAVADRQLPPSHSAVPSPNQIRQRASILQTQQRIQWLACLAPLA
jgi:hypothetical protein